MHTVGAHLPPGCLCQASGPNPSCWECWSFTTHSCPLQRIVVAEWEPLGLEYHTRSPPRVAHSHGVTGTGAPALLPGAGTTSTVQLTLQSSRTRLEPSPTETPFLLSSSPCSTPFPSPSFPLRTPPLRKSHVPNPCVRLCLEGIWPVTLPTQLLCGFATEASLAGVIEKCIDLNTQAPRGRACRAHRCVAVT